MSHQIIPGAVTVALTSGKGGVGKTTTAAALAAALAGRGLDVLVVDADVEGPNVHLVAGVADTTLGVDAEQLSMTLPTSRHGFRVATPVSVTNVDPKARVDATDLIGVARFAAPAQVVIVDLPPGWTDHHDTVCHTLPDLVVAVVAPTWPALSDHRRHLRSWRKEWTASVKTLRDRDKRRKVELPEAPEIVTVETMARFTGIPDHGGDPVTIRRIDAVATEKVEELAAPMLSLPATADVPSAAATPEMSKLADLVTELLPS